MSLSNENIPYQLHKIKTKITYCAGIIYIGQVYSIAYSKMCPDYDSIFPYLNQLIKMITSNTLYIYIYNSFEVKDYNIV